MSESGKASESAVWPFLTAIFSLYFVMTTPSWTIAGLPVFIVIPPLFCLYFLGAASWRLMTPPLLFALAFLIAAAPGTILGLFRASIKPSSLLLYLASLGMFIVYASTAMRAFTEINRARLSRLMELGIAAILFFALLEILFPLPFVEFRRIVFGAESSDYARDIEQMLFLRPTLFFSEASHAGRLAGIVCATYMLLEKYSLKSLLYFAATFLLIRSPSEVYVAPIFLVPFFRTILSQWRLSRLVALLIGGVVFLTLSFLIFRGRLLHLGTEGSAAERFVFPLVYLLTRWIDPYFGFGLGGHEGLYRFVFFSLAGTHPGMIKGLEVVAAPNSSIVTFGAIGIMGLLVAAILNYSFLRYFGLFVLFVFFSSAALVGGYNAPLTLVPFAFLFALSFVATKGFSDGGPESGIRYLSKRGDLASEFPSAGSPR